MKSVDQEGARTNPSSEGIDSACAQPRNDGRESYRAVESGEPLRPGVLLIVDDDQRRAFALASRLRVTGYFIRLRAPSSFPASEPDCHPTDVALIQIGSASGNAILQAQHALAQDVSTDVIFFAEQDCLELMIVRGLGLSRIISADLLPSWVGSAAPSLVRHVRARRALLDAQKHLPDIPDPVWSSAAPIVPLPVAEQRFREAFLRQLLSRNPNRESAARIAGIPYRTLCDILQRLGLSVALRPSEPRRLSIGERSRR